LYAGGNDAAKGQLFHEQFRKLGFIDYNGNLQVHGSLLNVILND